MTIATTMGVVGTAVSIGTGVAGAVNSNNASAKSRQQYQQALAQAQQLYNQSRNDIKGYMSPYNQAGQKGLGMLMSAIDPTQSPQSTWAYDPGAMLNKKQWADAMRHGGVPMGDVHQYQAMQNPVYQANSKTGLAGMV